MVKAKQLPKRSEVPEKLTWDLTRIFKNDSEFEKSYQELEKLILNLSKYQGHLADSSDILLEAINQLMSISRKLEVIYVYANMKNDQDTTNAKYQAMIARATSLYANFSEVVAYFNPEIVNIPAEKLQTFINEEPGLKLYRHYLDQLTSQREHVLSQEQESLLASASEFIDSGSDTFEIFNNADLKFPEITDEHGEKIEISHGVYGKLMESTDRNVRKNAFKSLYKVYDQFQHTTASTLSAHVKYHNFNAKVRHYESAREAALAQNKIPESVYDTLIKVVNEKLPLLHRYVSLRKRLLQVENLHMYDMYVSILEDKSHNYSYEKACDIVLKALEPLGTKYIDVVRHAFNNRWIDVVENQGKRSGAYSSGVYDTDPYILMNWHDSLDQMFTLAHEMGHSMHSYLTCDNQPYVYGDYSIFLAEIASTTNENLLTEYLLQMETDPRMKATILNHYLDGFKGTVFRQTQFAEFEQFIHTEDSKGIPLTSEYLNDYYGKLNAKYYGDDVVNDQEIALEWSRIPHFYYNFYVYQYATGFSAASALAKQILSDKQDGLEKYLSFLKAGSSDYPINIMKQAGVDMTRADYLYAAFDMFEQRLNELETIIDNLEKE